MLFKQITKRTVARLIFLLLLISFIKGFALNSFRVEKYYAAGFFPAFSNLLRFITGWIPFSLGDVFYFFAALWLLYKIIFFFIKLAKSTSKGEVAGKSLLKVVFIAMVVYIIFNIFWGLDYNRKGIAWQLNLQTREYTAGDLKNIQQLLIEKVNASKQVLVSARTIYPADRELFSRANKCYQQTCQLYPFLQYKHASVKTSIFSWWGNFLGFTGYYNPFTGEAQLNTTVPKFVLPYTTCHEMAHQLGYAKEDEANFVGYLAATSSKDSLFHYSTYLDLFVYANSELYFVDSTAAKKAFAQLSPPVKSDIKEWRDFLIRHRSFADAFISWAYGKYLKANQQPQGIRTYNEVTGDLIAFYKKTGKI